MSSVDNGGSAANGGEPPRNTRHPTGIRVTVALLAAMCVLLGPVGYAKGVAAETNSAAEWFTLGFGASVGLPLLGAAIATVAGDRRAAMYSLVLLAWPVVFVTALHLHTGT
ncbi:hypothetical protein F4561_002777 [Lipingzhangella halophila]|uniref:Uncharacterized protein n=1 Tax=Lipingzhangella halophila TaxID=1783352 RepID=A0A7W7RHF0_9ACTN|nr:hypothetical protein [Lipingzhangella halophila]MBB4931957.1 hypothetical protein [Lipingzhangella halophila]